MKTRTLHFVTWRASTEERDGHWATTSDPFGITMYGDTEEESEKRLSDAIATLFHDLIDSGEIDAYMKRLGVRVVSVDAPAQLPAPRRRTETIFTQPLEPVGAF